MSGRFSIVNGEAIFTSGSIMHTGSDGAPTSSLIAGKWEIDPDDGESLQLRIPKEKIGTTNDRIAFYVSASGEVGIGTKDPESAFDVRDIAEDVDPKRRDLKTKIFKVTKTAQKFDTPVTGSIVSASLGFIGDLTGTATNATNVVVTDDGNSANHPITFIDDTTPDGSTEGLKASRSITVNPSTGELVLGNLSITFTQGDGRTTFGTITFTAPDLGGVRRTATIDLR